MDLSHRLRSMNSCECRIAMLALGSLLLIALHLSTETTSVIGTLQSSPRPKSSLSATTSSILRRLGENGTKECHNVSTTDAYLFGLPSAENGKDITLSTDVVHKFWMVSYAPDGSRRCFGGDFYETDLSGNYTFRTILLYSNYHGLDHLPTDWALLKDMIVLRICFTSNRNKRPPIPVCKSSDFTSATGWSGKWTRTKFNSTCQLDKDERYRCLGANEECGENQCSGKLESLESNGWVYSAHCKFRLWNPTDAWKCLDGKKLFFWGDSNHQDTIRNLMNFILGMDQKYISRIWITNVTNPSNPNYRALVKEEFFRDRPPDAVIINSGIHDGHRWKNTKDFAVASKRAALFWRSLLGDSSKARVVIRNTITTAGNARRNPSNPHKMDAFNSILTSEFQQQLQHLKNLMFVDNYDLTFPWHYDHCCSDGGHYGIPGSLSPWFERVGDFYFVDIMLAHVLLTAICD